MFKDILIILIITVIVLIIKSRNASDVLSEKTYYKYVKREIDFPNQRRYKKIIYWNNYIKGTTDEILEKLIYRFTYKMKSIENITNILSIVSITLSLLSFMCTLACNTNIKKFDTVIEKYKYHIQVGKEISSNINNEDIEKYNKSIEDSYDNAIEYSENITDVTLIIYILSLIGTFVLLPMMIMNNREREAYYQTLILIIKDERKNRRDI